MDAMLPIGLHARNAATSMFGMHEPNVQLDPLDLKTLRLLTALLETGSVTRSGEMLGLSQPAASRGLERLRKALGDPLLVRTSKGYALTARAEALKPLAADAVAAVARMLEGERFDPATSRHTFRIAATDYGAVTVLSRVVARVVHEAPGVRLDIRPHASSTLSDLENGALDCAVDAEGELPPDFHYRELFRDDYVCLVREGHPCLSKKGRVLERVGGCPRAIMMYPEGSSMLPDDVLGDLGAIPSATALRTPYFMSTPWIIAETDLVICLPRRAGERLASLNGLKVLRLPNSPSFSYRLIWHERLHRNPAMQWLRSLICRTAAS